MKHARYFWFLLLVLPILASAAVGARPADGLRCSKSALPSRQPSVFFTGEATPVVVDAPVRGAGERLEQRFDGSVRAYLFEVHQLGGTDAAQVSAGGRVLVVPWGYTADCSPIKWMSDDWVEAGTTGLVYGQLRAREDWIDGVPIIDMHNPYQLPYPRRAMRTIALDDAFSMLTLLPPGGELSDRGVDALRPLWTWIRDRPELGDAEPARTLRLLLVELMYSNIRDLEPGFAGTYQFILELDDGATRTFYGRTESRAISPHRVESGDAFVQELRPPHADGYTIVVAVAPAEEALPASRNEGAYGYMYADMQPQHDTDGTRRWQGGAEWSLLTRAFPDDDAIRRLGHQGTTELRYFVEHNLPPSADASFRMLPDGSVTFHQQFRLPGGDAAVLRAERISTVTMPPPR